MTEHGMIIKDNHVYTDTLGFPGKARKHNGLVVYRRMLEGEIPYINENNIEYIQITLSDPRRYLTRDGFAIAPQGENSKRNYDVDISPLKNSKQIRSLTLEGNIIHSEVLEELPNLQILALDNTLGNTVIDVSKLHQLRFLLVQKPRKNIRGIEGAACLEDLRIWNYIPKSRNLTELTALKRLKYLYLVRPRIDTLEGVENIESLQKLEIYYSRTLKDITALDRCHSELETDFDHVPNMQYK